VARTGHDSGQNATTDDPSGYEPREVVEGFIPGRAMDELVAIVRDCRPWQAEVAVADAFVAWSVRHGPAPLPKLGAIDIAGCLAGLGRLDLRLNPEIRDDTFVVGIVWYWMANVVRGRGPLEYDLLGDHIDGFPERTMRRWRRQAGGISLQPAMVRIQRDQDLVGLVRKGYALDTARRWLQRHQGQHAADAPPPRRRGVDRPPSD
jgi:hypothetical protein